MKSVALFQFSLFVAYFIVTCRGLSCSGGSVSVSQGGPSTCYSTYAQSSAVSFFNGSVQNDNNCQVFSDFNFSNVTRNWSSHYTNCATDTRLFSILLVPDGSGTFPKLSSTRCIKYNTTSSVTCSCRMNCLLHFYEMPHNLYIYLEGIDCNETLYNTTIEGIQYDRDLSYSSNFTAKEDSIPCTIDPVVSSSSPLISSTSFASFTSNIMPSASVSSDPYISSTHFISPTPSNKSSSRSSLLIGRTLISSSSINFLIPSAPLTSFSHISSDIICSTVSNCCSLAGTSVEKCLASSTMLSDLSHNNKPVDIMSFTYGLLTGLLLSFLITSFVVLLFCCALKVRSKRKFTSDDVVLYDVPVPLAQATIPVKDNSAYGKAIQNPI